MRRKIFLLIYLGKLEPFISQEQVCQLKKKKEAEVFLIGLVNVTKTLVCSALVWYTFYNTRTNKTELMLVKDGVFTNLLYLHP